MPAAAACARTWWVRPVCGRAMKRWSDGPDSSSSKSVEAGWPSTGLSQQRGRAPVVARHEELVLLGDRAVLELRGHHLVGEAGLAEEEQPRRRLVEAVEHGQGLGRALALHPLEHAVLRVHVGAMGVDARRLRDGQEVLVLEGHPRLGHARRA